MAESNSVYVIGEGMASDYSARYQQPDQMIPESEKNPDWYYQNLRHWFSFFNIPLEFTQQSAINIGANYINSNDLSYNSNPAGFMIRMLLYYMGQQPNLNWNHLTQDVNTTNMQAIWVKGQKIKDLVEKSKGAILNRLAKSKFDAFPVGK